MLFRCWHGDIVKWCYGITFYVVPAVVNIWYAVRVVYFVIATDVADKVAVAATCDSGANELPVRYSVTDCAFLDKAVVWPVHGFKNSHIISKTTSNIVTIR